MMLTERGKQCECNWVSSLIQDWKIHQSQSFWSDDMMPHLGDFISGFMWCYKQNTVFNIFCKFSKIWKYLKSKILNILCKDTQLQNTLTLWCVYLSTMYFFLKEFFTYSVYLSKCTLWCTCLWVCGGQKRVSDTSKLEL